MVQKMQTAELAQLLNAIVEGDGAVELRGVAAVESAGPDEVAFAAGRKAAELAAGAKAGCLLVSRDFENTAGRPVIRVPEPRAAFAATITRFHPIQRPAAGVHSTAVVEPGVELGEGVSI